MNGLADNNTGCILQDSRGFIWFGTREGLSRFDGSRFLNFFAGKEDGHSLPANNVQSLHEFIPGHLLINCAGTAICLNTLTQQFYQPTALQHRYINTIISINKDLYSINCTDTSLIVNSRLMVTDTLIPPLKKSGSLTSLMPVNEKTWLTGTAYEYYWYDVELKKFTPFLQRNDLPLRDQMLHLHYYDKKNNWLYFSNFYEGLFRYSLTSKMIYHWKKGALPAGLPDANISFIVPQTDSTLWIGGAGGGGLIQLNTSVNLFKTAGSIAGNFVRFGYIDSEKNTWVGSTEGVSKMSTRSNFIKSWKSAFATLSSEQTLLNIRRHQDNNMYVAVYGSNQSFRINTKTDIVSPVSHALLPNTWCLNNFGDALIYTGSGTTVLKYNPVTGTSEQNTFLKKYFPVSDIVILAMKHSNGDEWYSGNNGGGFVRREIKTNTVHTYKKDGPRGKFTVSYYTNYIEDRQGDLWFGVNKSSRLLNWDQSTDYFSEVSFDTIKGITRKIVTGITDLAYDKTGNIWIAMDGDGLIRYDPLKKTARLYTLNDGLPSNYLFSLCFDGKNRLWAGTPKGLSCLITAEDRFINFSSEDGLPADYFDERCRYYDSTTNRLWIGAKNTLMCFDPDLLLKNLVRPLPLYLDEVFVNGAPCDAGAGFNNIHFSAEQNNLQFRFVSPDLSNGKDLEYSYRLSGADRDWIYNGSNTQATYANLSPGKYTFFIRAKLKGDRDWIPVQEPLTFSIATPWFKTTGFRLALVALAGFLVWLISRAFYLRKLEREKGIMEKQKAIEKERTRIATDMHDDFGATLSRIKFLSEKMQLQNRSNDRLEEELSKISGYSDEMAEKMNEIVWALNQKYDTLEDLVAFSRSYASEYLSAFNIELDFRDNCTDQPLNGEIRRNIFLVIKECLRNTAHHSGADKMFIEFKNSSELSVILKDDGKGIDWQNIRPYANGLANMKKRIADINGQISFSEQGGTNIFIVVPLV